MRSNIFWALTWAFIWALRALAAAAGIILATALCIIIWRWIIWLRKRSS